MKLLFTVDLSGTQDTLLTPTERNTFAQLRTALIPSLLLGDRLFRHGETFLLDGAHCEYVKKMIDGLRLTNVSYETGELPDVDDLTAEAVDGGVLVQWTTIDAYITEIYTKIGDGDWTVQPVDKGASEVTVSVEDIGVLVQVRARFTDDNGRFSPNYATAEATTEDFSEDDDQVLFGESVTLPNLAGLNDYSNNSIDRWSLATMNTTEVGLSQLVAFLPEYDHQYNLHIAQHDDKVYVLGNRVEYGGGSPTLVLHELVADNLNNGTHEVSYPNSPDESTITVSSFVFYGDAAEEPGVGIGLLCSGSILYTITTTGVVTLLKTDTRNFTSMAYDSTSGHVFAVEANAPYIFVIDPLTGDLIQDESGDVFYGIAAESESGYDLQFIKSLAVSAVTEGLPELIAFMYESETEQHYIGTIDLTELTATFDRPMDDQFESIFYVTFPEAPQALVGVTFHEAFNLPNLTPGTLYNIAEGPSLLRRFDFSDSQEDAAVAWSESDGYFYHVAQNVVLGGETSSVVFNKWHPDYEDEITSIELSGHLKLETVDYNYNNSYIADGGDDMYDTGNFLGTNRGSDVIQYTHAQQSSDEEESDFVEIADGTVADGTAFFGSSSEYFTNMYTGLFVLASRGIDIEWFEVAGGLGADSGGHLSSRKFYVTVGPTTYTVFNKKIYEASEDPSVNHLIIVNGDTTNAVQLYNADTNSDMDRISGLGGSNTELYYLLYAGRDGYKYTDSEDEAIAEAFLQIVSGQADLTAALAALNTSVTDVTSEMGEHLYTFSDHGNSTGTQEFGDLYGIDEPNAMVATRRAVASDYSFDGPFILADDNGLYEITKDGVVSNPVSTGDSPVVGMAWYNDTLYGVTSDGPYLIVIDPDTRQFVNTVEGGEDEAGFDTILTVDGSDLSFQCRGLTVRQVGEEQQLVLLTSGDEDAIVYTYSLNPETGECTLLTGFDEQFIDLTSYGTSPPITSEWFGAYEAEVSISVNVSSDAPVPDIENMEAQWNPEGYSEDGTIPTTGWVDTTVDDFVPSGEGGGGHLVIGRPADNILLRLRYTSPSVSDWKYVWYD
jgi:hypothetical protein